MEADVARQRREPVSFEQERVWLEEQHAPGQRPSAAVVAIRGPLDTAALGQAVTGLAARHPSLRTTFAAVDDSPVAVVTGPAQVALVVSEAGPDGAYASAMATAAEPVPLGPGTLLRASLIREASDHHLLVLAAHRIIADEQSLAIMLTELGALYAAHTLPAPPQQTCAGYAIWQRDMLARGGFDTDLQYWRGQLESTSPLRLLPSTPSADTAVTARRAIARLATAGTLRRLREFAAAHSMCAQHVITAGCLAAIARYTTGDDAISGCTLSSRSQPGLGSLIGQFGNVLPLRVSLAGDPSFAELASRAAAAMIRAEEHGRVPLQALASALSPPRDAGSCPFFEAVIDVAAGCGSPAAAPAPPCLPGLATEVLDVTAPVLAAGLCISAKVTREELELAAEYPEGRCGQDWAQALLAHIAAALSEGMEQPRRPISALPLLTPDEHATVTSIRGPQRSYPFVTLQELVWRQTARTPHAPAVTCQQDQATYAQLRQGAQCAAAALRAAGAGPGTTVGVLLPGGSELVTGILGALTTGGAFAQLDPREPAERVARRCEQAGVSFALTSQALRPLLPASVTAVVNRESGVSPAAPARAQGGLPSRGEGMDSPCAVLFTGSGSAVTVSHRNVVAAVSGLLHALGAERFHGSLLTSAVSDSDGMAQLFPALVTGGTVVIAGERGHVPDGATIMTATAADVSRSLRQAPLPPAVRTLIVSGGQLPGGLAAHVFERSSVSDIYACYGSAQTTTYTLVRRVARGGEQRPGHQQTLANTSVLVLDRYGNSAPPGVSGELCVAGPVVASEYQPVYRTGEVARVHTDGELELLARPGQHDATEGAGDAPATGTEPASGEFAAPRTGTERRVAEIYAEVLGVSQVGVFDDFFDLGGSSMAGTAVLGRIRQHFAVTIPMADFMGAATVEVIAQAVDDALLAQVTAEDIAAAMAAKQAPAAPTEAHDHG